MEPALHRSRPASRPRGIPPATARPEGHQGHAFLLAQALIDSRRNTSPRRLVDPGPGPDDLQALMGLAAAAPDHGRLTPWRFILVPPERRHRLAEAFALALVDRDPGATLEQIEAAREKAFRAPTLLVAVARLDEDASDIPELERMVSMGAAIQNLLLGAHAMGFGAGLTSGRAMASPRVAGLLGLRGGEHAVCCVNVGSVQGAPKARGARPAPGEFLSVLPA